MEGTKLTQEQIDELRKDISLIRVPPNGRVVLFDKEDEAKVLPYTWHEDPAGYIIRAALINEQEEYGFTIRLSRWLLGLTKQDQLEVDHINNVKWDNRKQNLRLATTSENVRNQLLTIRNTTGVKGVCHRICTHINQDGTIRQNHYWRARIRINKQCIEQNFSHTLQGLIAASQWYDKMAIKYFGKFAKTNEMINNQPNIIQELEALIPNDVKSMPFHKAIVSQSNYLHVHLSHEKWKQSDGSIADHFNWKAFITQDYKVVFRKFFPYTNAGLILAAEAVRDKLIELNKNVQFLKDIDYSICSAEELEQARLALQGTSQYHGVYRYIRQYKTINNKITQKAVWIATVTHNRQVVTKQFEFTPQGEQQAALWYNEQAKKIFGTKAKINIIDSNKTYKYFDEDNHQILINNLKASNDYTNDGYFGLKEESRNGYLPAYIAFIILNDKKILFERFPYTLTGKALALQAVNKKLESLNAFELLNVIDESLINQEELEQIDLISVSKAQAKRKNKTHNYWKASIKYKNYAAVLLFPFDDKNKELAKIAANMLRHEVYGASTKINKLINFELLTDDDIYFVINKTMPYVNKIQKLKN